MRSSLLLVSLVGLSISALEAAPGEDRAAALAIADKAIDAVGDRARVTRLHAATWKLKGTFHGLENAIAFNGDWAMQWPDQSRIAIEGEANGQKFSVTLVVNRDKGWIKGNNETREMDRERIQEQREDAHGNYLLMLASLKDKSLALSPLGELKIDDRPAIGIKVTQKGYRDVDLYFDKSTNLLQKSERRVKNPEGQELNQETFFSGYKEFDGLKLPTKITIKRDGKLYVESDSSEIKLVEKLDDGVFEKP